MARRIENLLAHLFRNFDGLKNLYRPPVKDRIQDLVNGSLHVAITTYICCYCNIKQGKCKAQPPLYREFSFPFIRELSSRATQGICSYP